MRGWKVIFDDGREVLTTATNSSDAARNACHRAQRRIFDVITVKPDYRKAA